MKSTTQWKCIYPHQGRGWWKTSVIRDFQRTQKTPSCNQQLKHEQRKPMLNYIGTSHIIFPDTYFFWESQKLWLAYPFPTTNGLSHYPSFSSSNTSSLYVPQDFYINHLVCLAYSFLRWSPRLLPSSQSFKYKIESLQRRLHIGACRPCLGFWLLIKMGNETKEG